MLGKSIALYNRASSGCEKGTHGQAGRTAKRLYRSLYPAHRRKSMMTLTQDQTQESR